jgi:hypothetical protein
VSRRPGFVALVALALLLAGCQVDATVTIDVEDDGSGVVTVDVRLDAAAVRATESGGATLDQRVRLADLDASGWRVGGWERADDGSATIRLSKAFTAPDQVAGIIAEISGTEGPLRDFDAARDRSMLATQYDVRGVLDLAAITTGIGADPDLVGSLTNQQVDVLALDQSLLQQVRDALSVEVVVNLPGGETVTVDGVLGQRVAIDASSSVRDTRRIVLILLAVVLIVLAVVVWVGGRHTRRRARARQPIPRFDPHASRP